MEPRALLATLTVNSIADSVVADGGLTLREAIMVANGDLAVSSLSAQEQAQVAGPLATSPAPNTIAFNLPGSGVRTISPTSELPNITKPLVIDGYTQSGSHPNTLAVGTNAVVLVALDGSMAGSGFPAGLKVIADDSVVQGLVIGKFDAAIVVAGTGDAVRGDFLGTDASGTVAAPNNNGIVLAGAQNATIGGTAVADRNLVSGNQSDGIDLRAATDSFVRGNLIGTDATGLAALGNGGPGVYVEGESMRDVIGGTQPGEGNRIAFNGTSYGAGAVAFLGDYHYTTVQGPQGPVMVPTSPDSPTAVAVEGNLIFSAGGAEIGFVANGPLVAESTPVITTARPDHVDGTVAADPGAMIHVELFASVSGSIVPSLVGTAEVVADASGVATFHIPIVPALPAGAIVKATATGTSPAVTTSAYSDGARVFDHTVHDFGVVGGSIPTTPAGNSVTYVFTVTNSGSDLDSGDTLTVTLPSNTQFSASSPYDANTYIPPSGGNPARLVFPVGTLAPGASKPFTILTYPIKVGALTATAVLSGATVDDDPTNDSASLTANVVGTADLAASLIGHTPDSGIGQPIDFSLRVTNAGPDGAYPLRIANILLRNPDGSPAPGASRIASVKVDGTPFPFVGDGADLIDMTTGAVTVTVELIPLLAGDFLFNPTVSTVATDPTPADATLSVAVKVLPPPDVTAPTASAPVAVLSRNGGGTPITIGFSEALYAPLATDRASYAIVLAGRDGKFNTRDDKSVPIAGASYDPVTHAVTITTKRKLSPALKYQLSISRVKDVSGNVLAGGVERFLFRPIAASKRPAPGKR
jgi:Domain of unknown function DUF11/Bacterial Ig-like domain